MGPGVGGHHRNATAANLAVLVLRESGARWYKPSYSVPLYPVVPILGLVACLFLLASYRDKIEWLPLEQVVEQGMAMVLQTFNISKAGTIAGCYVLDGTITRNTKVRLIRDGIVMYTGALGSLKRFKDDVKEVKNGYECGLNIENYNDIKVGDIIEGYEEVEVKQSL